jgi:hypothetical protein
MTPEDFDRRDALLHLTLAYAWGVLIGWLAAGYTRR